MTQQHGDEYRHLAVQANLEGLLGVLYDVLPRVEEAVGLMRDGRSRNEAIGAVAGVGEALDAARALYGAAVAVHQRRPEGGRS